MKCGIRLHGLLKCGIECLNSENLLFYYIIGINSFVYSAFLPTTRSTSQTVGDWRWVWKRERRQCGETTQFGHVRVQHYSWNIPIRVPNNTLIRTAGRSRRIQVLCSRFVTESFLITAGIQFTGMSFERSSVNFSESMQCMLEEAMSQICVSLVSASENLLKRPIVKWSHAYW